MLILFNKASRKEKDRVPHISLPAQSFVIQFDYICKNITVLESRLVETETEEIPQNQSNPQWALQ